MVGGPVWRLSPSCLTSRNCSYLMKEKWKALTLKGCASRAVCLLQTDFGTVPLPQEFQQRGHRETLIGSALWVRAELFCVHSDSSDDKVNFGSSKSMPVSMLCPYLGKFCRLLLVTEGAEHLLVCWTQTSPPVISREPSFPGISSDLDPKDLCPLVCQASSVKTAQHNSRVLLRGRYQQHKTSVLVQQESQRNNVFLDPGSGYYEEF